MPQTPQALGSLAGGMHHVDKVEATKEPTAGIAPSP